MGKTLYDIKLEGYAPLEVTLQSPDDFLKIRETLQRIGVASRKDKILYQSCHILHKAGKYFLVGFKELFALDQRETNITYNDIQRRNSIAHLLSDWGLLNIVDLNSCSDVAPMSQIKVISFAEKSNWKLESKYTIGRKSL